ncbi:glyoxalase/bleomycin resistance protein/dioxygenase [Pseudonocardia dioxanivorans] [Mycobacterium shimoidei]|uniref:Glyoxalase/bleomycin resistance protein/dioxygenase [Pseudonocardia dioxanivorans] n=1 Tax=Mycobacterium shimoidei TaxID=29313 RepID=A0A375Z1H9_MYCSH|nr:glyoxalase/bleomycin resistance protein/dioxygenase [Pseudonocardia dioxanivorans] [Mycobacterium shimoidei]
MATVSVRYIVNDVDAAIAFYCTHLGFHEDMCTPRPPSRCCLAEICASC